MGVCVCVCAYLHRKTQQSICANCYDNVTVHTTNAENNLHLIKAADYNQLFTPVTGLNLPHSGWDLKHRTDWKMDRTEFQHARYCLLDRRSLVPQSWINCDQVLATRQTTLLFRMSVQ